MTYAACSSMFYSPTLYTPLLDFHERSILRSHICPPLHASTAINAHKYAGTSYMYVATLILWVKALPIGRQN